jgi:hypothetical protein
VIIQDNLLPKLTDPLSGLNEYRCLKDNPEKGYIVPAKLTDLEISYSFNSEKGYKNFGDHA